jgi:hypothetical protein
VKVREYLKSASTPGSTPPGGHPSGGEEAPSYLTEKFPSFNRKLTIAADLGIAGKSPVLGSSHFECTISGERIILWVRFFKEQARRILS